MMDRKLLGVSVAVFLVVTGAVALPSKGWASAGGWTTESSLGSGGWQQSSVPADDSQGKGWVSSESGPVSKTKAVPTSWQKVYRHQGKSSGWTNVGQKTAEDIAKGFVVHHPIPNSNSWNPSPLESWTKQNSNEYWPVDSSKKGSSSSTISPAAWEKAIADAKEQWQSSDASKSSWETKSVWEKTPDASSTSLWNKNSSPSVWQNAALNDRESAAGYAATGPAQYGQESNGWQKNSQSNEVWKKDSTPSTLYDAPSKWNNKPTSGQSEWQKASTGWDGSSTDFKTWQKETNGWNDGGNKGQTYPASNGWQQGIADLTTQKPWQQDAPSSGWQKSSSAISNGWN